MKNKFPFTKSDLKTGYMVELANGSRFRVLLATQHGDWLVNDIAGFVDDLKDFGDDMQNLRSCNRDIVAVYIPNNPSEILFNGKHTKVWGKGERMTIREVESKYNVEVVV